MSWYSHWAPYVPVWKRQQQAAKQMDKLRKKGLDIQPVVIEGRTIAHTFWGKAWCEHLEKFSDYENRLPRGRSYVRNGSVCHLDIQKGKIEAKVSGSSVYDVQIAVKTLPPKKWKDLKGRCAGRVGSMLELLQGRMSNEVMSVVTDRDDGMFPLPKEISLDCSCPDWADMCKHVAAVLYGVGARLDNKPELLFLLRGVDHSELVSEDSAKAVVAKAPASKDRILDAASLTDVFGIDLAHSEGKADSRVPTDSKTSQPKTRQSSGPVSRRKQKVARVSASPRRGKADGKPKRYKKTPAREATTARKKPRTGRP